jgi:citrate synthase
MTFRKLLSMTGVQSMQRRICAMKAHPVTLKIDGPHVEPLGARLALADALWRLMWMECAPQGREAAHRDAQSHTRQGGAAARRQEVL